MVNYRIRSPRLHTILTLIKRKLKVWHQNLQFNVIPNIFFTKKQATPTSENTVIATKMRMQFEYFPLFFEKEKRPE